MIIELVEWLFNKSGIPNLPMPSILIHELLHGEWFTADMSISYCHVSIVNRVYFSMNFSGNEGHEIILHNISAANENDKKDAVFNINVK